MQYRVKLGGLAAAAVTALSGLGLVGLAPSASAAVTIPAKPYDFNGDGFADEAIGSPYGTVSGHRYAGFVNIIYGSSSGLNTSKRQVFSQNSTNVPGAAEVSDHFGYSLASGDFDHDGFADLAVGVPDEDTGNGANAGGIAYLWGTQNGLVADPNTWDDEPAAPGAGHRFGESLSVGDIERDGHPELFFTVPGTSQFSWFFFSGVAASAIGRTAHAGDGTSRSSVKTVIDAKTGKSTDARAGTLSLEDVNNSWLATGDVTGDGHDDVVYAWNDADWPVPEERHGFIVYPGTAEGGLDVEASVGIINVDVNSATVGDFDGDGFGDVALGQTPDANRLGGAVTVFKGAATNVSLETDASYWVHQDSPSVPGSGEAGDAFGASVAAGDITHDGTADLVVGAPTEDIGTAADAGATFVLPGSATGLTGVGSQMITQNTAGVPGGCETGDKFGTQVTLLDNNRDNVADLTAGAPAENAGDGMISWLKGTATGVTGTGSLGIGSGTFGVTGQKAEIGRRLGRLG
ncbi:MAG TPA: hypothetical protein VE465_07840 [Streptosporangiaceae bacterium]|nr:hypothetical protein [Streptosporangiaceae bacterium]